MVCVGYIFADEMDGELYAQVYIVLPNRAGDDFVVQTCWRSARERRHG